MRYLLDTNILSYWMRGDPGVTGRIASHAPSELSFSVITLAEILYGIARSPWHQEERRHKLDAIATLLRLIPFDSSAAHEYADIRAELERTGQPISERDTQIASVARSNGLVVVTHNTREFHRVRRLQVEDWS